jgi:SAM-dependent methyltransferase
MERRDKFVRIDCPSCGHKWEPVYFLFRKDGCLFVECVKCHTVYINPRPTPQLLEDYYSNSEHYKYWSKYIFPQTEETRREQIFKPRALQVWQYALKYKQTDRLLDIGAGYGTFCEELINLEVFQSVCAVEPSVLSKECIKRGIETIDKPIEQVDIKNINCITAFELIEHLYSPQDFIKKCYEILTKNGLLILTCPNVQGFDIAVLKENSDQFNPEHLNYFNPKSLSLLLENNGFEVLEVSTPGKLDVDIVKNKVAQKKYTPGPFIQSLLDTGEKFQQFLVENNLSSHLWMVARKK